MLQLLIVLFSISQSFANNFNTCDAYLSSNLAIDQNGYIKFQTATSRTDVSWETGYDIQVFIDDPTVSGGYDDRYDYIIRGVYEDSMPNEIYFLRDTTYLPDPAHGGWGAPLGQAFVSYGYGLITTALNCGLPKNFNYAVELYQDNKLCSKRVGTFNGTRFLPQCAHIYDMDEDGDTDMDDYYIFFDWEPKSLLDFAEFQVEFE